MIVGNKIRKYRLEHKLTLGQLAEKADISLYFEYGKN